VQTTRRRAHKGTTHIFEEDGRKKKTTQKEIVANFVDFYKKNFQPLTVDQQSMILLRNLIKKKTPTEMQTILEAPIMEEELRKAVLQGTLSKSPGEDRICHEFYLTFWDTIKGDLLQMFNSALQKGSLDTTQTTGIIVYIPKIGSPKPVRHYRPSALLNGDYRIFARIIAKRMRQTVTDILHPAQSSSTTGRTIMDAVATIRDARAHAEVTGRPGCVLSLDFAPAFDRMSHEYLYHILDQYGYGKNMVNTMKTLYTGAQSEVQKNGFLSHSFLKERSVPQGCPSRMILYTLAMNPFLMMAERELTGIAILQKKNAQQRMQTVSPYTQRAKKTQRI
jgi:hypothetical protein